MRPLYSALCALTLLGCEPSTGGRTVEITFAVRGASNDEGHSGPTRRFTTRSGWDIELEEAWVAVGPFVVWENPPPLMSALAPPARPASLWNLLVTEAYAHPGDSHFNGGDAKAEWMGQTLLDALAVEPQRFSAPGVAGPARSVTIHLEPPRVNLSGRARLEGDFLRASGSASREGEQLRFRGGIRLPAEGGRREIRGIPLDAEIDDDVSVELEIDPAAWFIEADFSELVAVEPEADGYRNVPAEGAIAAAWTIGARSLTESVDEPSAARARIEVAP